MKVRRRARWRRSCGPHCAAHTFSTRRRLQHASSACSQVARGAQRCARSRLEGCPEGIDHHNVIHATAFTKLVSWTGTAVALHCVPSELTHYHIMRCGASSRRAPLQAVTSAAAALAAREAAFLLVHYDAATALSHFERTYSRVPAVLRACSHSLHALRHRHAMRGRADVGTGVWDAAARICRGTCGDRGCVLLVLHQEAFETAFQHLSAAALKLRQLDAVIDAAGTPLDAHVRPAPRNLRIPSYSAVYEHYDLFCCEFDALLAYKQTLYLAAPESIPRANALQIL